MKKAFDINSYQKTAVQDLILFGIYLVAENREKCTFERLAKECFRLSPQVFSFSKYPQWPDSRKLDRPLRALRNKKLIAGDPATEFSLTKLGKKTAAEITQTFRQKKLFK